MIVSPEWPPMTEIFPLTSAGGILNTSPKKVSARTKSKVVIPKSFSGLNLPNCFNVSAAIGTVEFTGLEIIKTIAWGEYLATPPTRPLTIPALILNKSARVMPGLRGTPAGIITNSVPVNAAFNSDSFAGSSGWYPRTVALLLMWDKSAATPLEPRISYNESSLTNGESFKSKDNGWPIPPAAPRTATLTMFIFQNTSNKIFDQLLDIVKNQSLALVQAVLVVLLQVVDGKKWELLFLIQVLGVSTKLRRIQTNKVDFASVLLGKLSDLWCPLGSFFWTGVEQVSQRNLGSHVLLESLAVDLSEVRFGLVLDELGQGLGLDGFIEDSRFFIRSRSEHQVSRLLDIVLGNQILIGCAQESEFVSLTVGDLSVNLVKGRISLWQHLDDHRLFSLLKSFRESSAVNVRLDCRQSLFEHVAGDGLGLSSTLVRLGIINASEDFDGRITSDAMSLTQLGVSLTVDLCQRNVLVLQCGSSLDKLWAESFTVATPRSIELSQYQWIFTQELLEILSVKLNHMGIFWSSGFIGKDWRNKGQ